MIRSPITRVSLAAPALLLAAWLAAAPAASAQLLGEVSGWVKDARGTPQMGATVSVTAPNGQVVKRIFSDHRGAFLIEGLMPGEYAVRVTLSSFMPVVREKLMIVAGSRKVLDVSLHSLFTSLQLINPGRGEILDMTDDWKWVLRAAHSSRPALRFTPREQQHETDRVLRKVSGVFSDTRAYAQVSGGGAISSGLANETDLGTSFAVATSLFGENDVTVAGNVGYSASSNSPTKAFRTSYSRDLGMGLGAPEVSLTVRQLQTSAAAGRAFLDPQQAAGEGAPLLESMTLGYGDQVALSESTTLEYGFLYESVRFLDRLDFVSPYGKLSRTLTPRRKLELRYASGAPRPDLAVQGREHLRQQVSALGMFPRVALRDGEATVQRTEHIEVAYREQLGHGLVEAAIYQDTIDDAAVSAIVPDGLVAGGNVLPDLFSRSSTLNGGAHQLRGYRISYARKIADRLEAALGYGSSGVLTVAGDQLQTADLGEIRDRMTVDQAHLIVASLSAEAPRTATKIVSSYQWASRSSVMSPDVYNEFAARSDPGLNLLIRQPLPFNSGLPGQFEVSADFRNLLKNGYVPVQAHDGRMIYLLPAVRSYRGSLNFIF